MARERGQPFGRPPFPERDNIPPREKGGSVFTLSAPPRPDRSTSPTREAPPPPTKLQQPLREAIIDGLATTTDLPKRKRGENKLLKTAAKAVRVGVATVVLLGGTAVGVALGVKHFLGEDNPSSADSKTQSVGSVPISPEGPVLAETKQVNHEEVFDNNAKKTSIGPNNIHFIDSDNIGQYNLKSIVNKKEQTISFPFPFKMPVNTTGTIERIDLADTDPNAQDPTQRPPVALIDFKFDDIVTAAAPEDTHIYLIRGIQDWGQDPNLAGQVWFYKYYEEEDATVAWRFTDNNPTKMGSFNNLLPMQDFDKNILRGTNYESLPVVDALTEVMTTTEPNQQVRLSVMAYKGKIVGPEAAIAGDDFLLKPHFFTNSSNAAEKLLAFKKE